MGVPRLNRLARLICAIAVCTTVLLSTGAPFAAEGPNLPPADYKVLPKGTTLNYGTVRFVVQSVDGLDTVYNVTTGRRRVLLGTTHAYAVFGRAGELAYSESAKWSAELGGEARKALEAMWPLEVGKKAAFEVEEQSDGNEVGYRTWRVNLEVKGVGVTIIGLDRFPVFIVEEKGSTPSTFKNDAADYVAEYQYNPGSGLILEYHKVWNSSERFGETDLWNREFVSVEYGEGAGDLQLVALPPPETTATVDIARLKAEADARLKTEIARLNRESEKTLKAREAEAAKAREAEIARLNREAEKTLKAREAEAAKAREAEIARLNREAKETLKAREAEAAKAREAEIARLRREAEEARKAEIAQLKEEARKARMARSSEGDKARLAEILRLQQEIEQRHWESIRDSQDLAAVQDYLKQYPKGRFTQEAKARVAVLQRLASASKIDFGNYHALVIGINDYKNLPKLQMAVNDAKAVAEVLKDDYGFKVTLLIDPDRLDIIDAFDELQETLTGKDNLLIYYAGHGWLNEKVDRGYWLPANAKPKRRGQWISNATVTDTLKGLSAKHVMVVADSCYSGTLVRSVDVGARKRTGDYWRRMATKWARVAITSGGLEPVADKGGGDNSPFAKAFLDTLRGNTSVMDGTTLFAKMRRPVMLNAQQTPQYSDVRNAGHDGGDFLFVRRK